MKSILERMKNNIVPIIFMVGVLALVSCDTETAEKEKKTDSLNPADNLPSHITRLDTFRVKGGLVPRWLKDFIPVKNIRGCLRSGS